MSILRKVGKEGKMVTLFKNRQDFNFFVGSYEWHDSYLKEFHFGDPVHEIREPERKGTAGSGATLMRVLIVSTWDDLAIEIVAYEAEQFSIHINNDLEGNKFSTIRRRCTELDFGAFYIKCACAGYREVPIEAVVSPYYYTEASLFGDDGEPDGPYRIDWRTIMDDSYHPQ